VIANTLRRLAALGAALGASAVLAQTPPAFPLKPVRLIVPFAPGGANDIVARLVGARLGESWTQAVLIENRPGAGATLGMELVARAAPDGYTLGAGNQSSLVIGPLLNPKVAYDPQRDLAAIGSTAATPYVIAVNARVPLRSLADLLRLARAKPGFLSYGTAGSGTISHIATELLLDATGTRMLHVPYKGAGPYLTALIAGESPSCATASCGCSPRRARDAPRPRPTCPRSPRAACASRRSKAATASSAPAPCRASWCCASTPRSDRR
jgi:tripartite-type tricarboxylate transporter receptor subunit TctC